MARVRVCGIELPSNKRLEIALTYLFGIGRSRSLKIISELGLSTEDRLVSMSDSDISRLTAFIEGNFVIEGDLRRERDTSIKRLRAIKCYRGLRRFRSLPVRGQRTKTNARTCKGPRRTVANKKK